MPPDPQRQADTREWFRKAYQDLRYAEIDLAATPPAPGIAIQDLAVARCAYQAAMARGLGTRLQLD